MKSLLFSQNLAIFAQNHKIRNLKQEYDQAIIVISGLYDYDLWDECPEVARVAGS
jgi:hypothetical protein